MNEQSTQAPPVATVERAAVPIIEGRDIVKTFGHVVALDHADFALDPGEVLAVIGDNGAGKSTLIKVLCGATVPDSGQVLLDGEPVHFQGPLDARRHGIETVFQDLALCPALDIATNMFLGRERQQKGFVGSVMRRLDKRGMRIEARRQMGDLKIGLQSMTQAVENLSGGQRQGVAVARAAAWGRKLVIMDEPTAALGVRESGQVLELIRRVRDRGLAVILISHNMPQVFEIADRIHVMRLGRRAAIVRPQDYSMSEVVAIMTGAMKVDHDGPR